MNSSTSPADIRPDHMEIVQDILRAHIPDGFEVWVFGSRAKWMTKDSSDLDLAVSGVTSLDPHTMFGLEIAFEESSLPYTVDVVDLNAVSDSFRRIVEAQKVLLPLGSAPKNMETAWRDITLGDCATLVRETVSPSNLADTPYIGLEHIGVGTLSLVGHGMASDVTSTKTRFQCDDILFGKLRPYFRKVVRAPFGGICSTDIWVVRAQIGIDQSFLYYCMASQPFVDFATSGSEGTRMPRANWKWVSQYRISLPPLPEQRAIAQILGALDDKIELNRRMNETLEAMARAIFQDWFVNFGPTRAKMAGQEPYLPPEVWELFPDRLVDSELGEIPAGWEVGRLSNVANSPRRGVSPSDFSEDTSYIGLEHMPRRSITLSEWESARKVTSNKSVFSKGEFLFGKLRPYFHKVGIAPVNGVCSTDIIVIVPKSNSWSGFVLLFISADEFVAYTDQTSTGTRMPRTNWKAMGGYELCLPSDDVVGSFQSIIEPMIDHTIANIHESRALTAQRDALLPKLVSGELRVRE